MSKNPESASMIFQSCTLNRNPVEKWNYSSCGYVGNIISISNHEAFETGLDCFLDTSKGKYISRNFLKSLIESTLIGCKSHSDLEVNIRTQWFNDHIKTLAKARDFKVVKTVFGGEIINSSQPIKLGVLTFYEVPRHGDRIKLPFDNPYFLQNQPAKTVAEYCALSKDEDKALELADVVFNSFDLSMAFLLAERNLDFSIGILRKRFAPIQQPIVFTDGGLFGKDEKNHNFKPELDLTKLARFCPDQKESTLKSLFNIALSPRTEIEKKISRSIEWLGEAYLDNNHSSALLKIVIALEALFKVDERSVITASIMASMAEQCAYINGRSAEHCVQIESYVKGIYGLRSSIVHTGSSSVRETILKKALEFTRATIFNLLFMKLDLEIETMSKLQELIRAGKYKACPIWHPKI